MPVFSIILPFYMAEDTLAETLTSLQTQTFTDWEAICVDDRGTDGARAIAESFARTDARIRVCSHPGKGPSDARNFAVAQSSGTYLAFLDADDIWVPAKLATLAEAFAEKNAAALYAQIGFFNVTPGDGTTVSTVLPGALSIRDLLAENPVCTLSNLAVRASAFEQVGGFNREIVHNEDLDLLIRLIGEGHMVAGVDTLLTWYRASATGLSSNMQAMLNSRRLVVQSAARYGVAPTRADDAVYMRYLARRALRLSAPHKEAWDFARQGLRLHPVRFLRPFKRGAATAVAAAAVRCFPSSRKFLRA